MTLRISSISAWLRTGFRFFDRRAKTAATFLADLGALLIALYGTAAAQQAPKLLRVGFLAPGSAASYSTRVEAFRQGLRELGYTSGENLTVVYRFADGSFDRLPHFASELVGLRVDAIVAGGQPAVHAAKQATTSFLSSWGRLATQLGLGLSTASHGLGEISRDYRI